jgi:hypothetical protein
MARAAMSSPNPAASRTSPVTAKPAMCAPVVGSWGELLTEGVVADGDTEVGDGDGDSEVGDGEGDSEVGDGDGDSEVGDGDGDSEVGDADGDSEVGDGDGDSEVGDADGDLEVCIGDGDCEWSSSPLWPVSTACAAAGRPFSATAATATLSNPATARAANAAHAARRCLFDGSMLEGTSGKSVSYALYRSNCIKCQ